jgi:hypothetical protein
VSVPWHIFPGGLTIADVVLEFPENPNDRWLIPPDAMILESEEPRSLTLLLNVQPPRPPAPPSIGAEQAQTSTQVAVPPHVPVALRFSNMSERVVTSFRKRYKTAPSIVEVSLEKARLLL